MTTNQIAATIKHQLPTFRPVGSNKNENITYTLKEILADTSIPPKHIVEKGILVPGGITLIHGKPKTRKSFLAIQLGLHLACGTPWLGFKVSKPQKALYIQAELSYHALRGRLHEMSRKLRLGKDTSKLIVSDCIHKNIDNPDEYSALRRMIINSKAEVIIIDPLVYFHGKSENSNDEMGKVMSCLRSLVNETSTALVLVHHDGKTNDYSGGDSSRGASAIFGAVDTDIQISKETTKGSSIPHQKLNFSMRHSKTPDTKNIYFDDETLTFSENHITSDEVKLLQVVVDHPLSDRPTITLKLQEVLQCGKSKAYELIRASLASETLLVNDAGLIVLPIPEF